MNTPARHSLAILGAGPVGLEAAAAALELGFDVHVFERGEVGSHLRGWGHVRMFTPWSMNVGPATSRLLKANGWTPPPADECPTGDEFADRVLLPLVATPELKGRVHTHEQVVQVARRSTLQSERIGDPARADEPFRMLVRNAGGHESLIHAFSLLDATGTFGTPAWAGTGGIPGRGEQYLAPQMSYRPDDVLGLRRERQRLLLRLSPFVHVQRQPTPRSPLRPAPRRLRSACYRALFTGLIDGSRFDAMMVLGARAGRRLVAPPASESSPSSSLSLPSPGARGVGAAGRVGAAPSARR